MVITGTSRGIGKYLASYYCEKGFTVIGCSKKPLEYQTNENYHHFCLDIHDEKKVKELFSFIRKTFGRLDILINNAGIASMNHSLLTPTSTVEKILNTNIAGTFLFCRESAKLMKKFFFGRIINFSTIAVPIKLEGEAIYASSKSAVNTLSQILSREYSSYGITVNVIAPTLVETDLIKKVSDTKKEKILQKIAIPKYTQMNDITNVIDFFIKSESNLITGQIIYLGGP
ncbi:MAG: SDR family oxidoreductase [Nitrosopumilus sp.]|nr:SDR family oxidoreductase [Nitrosopumilus sp.]